MFGVVCEFSAWLSVQHIQLKIRPVGTAYPFEIPLSLSSWSRLRLEFRHFIMKLYALLTERGGANDDADVG